MGKRQMEGDANERRKAAREARAQGKLPSEMSATLGASKQRKSAKSKASHDEKLATKREGKRGQHVGDEPRPGNREVDPKRTNRWG